MNEATLHRIVTSEPINAQAHRVMQRGTHYEGFAATEGTIHSADPLPIVSPPTTLPSKVGMSIGRMKVIGFSGRWNAAKSPMWVVKCACGCYEVRSAKAINRNVRTRIDDMCQRCRWTAGMRSRSNRKSRRPIFTPLPAGKKHCGGIRHDGGSEVGRCITWINLDETGCRQPNCSTSGR